MVKKSSKSDISKKVMEDINNQEIKMRPKFYFTLLTWALVASTTLFIMLSALTCLIAYRQISYGNNHNLGEFGAPGYTDFVIALPWMAIIAGMLTFVAAYTIIKRFDVSYRYKLYVLLAALVVAVAGLGIVFANIGADDKAKELVPLRGLHSFESFIEDHSRTGVIIEMQEDGFVMETKDGVENVCSEDMVRAEIGGYDVGDTVTVYGDEHDGKFKAYGARLVENPNQF